MPSNLVGTRTLAAAALVAAFAVGALKLAAAPSYSDWSVPVRLDAVVNSPHNENGPALSKNRLSLYFSSDRPGGAGVTDIWVSQRSSAEEPWGQPVNPGPPVNTTFAEAVPSFSRDGHWMFFNSDRPGSLGGSDVWAAWRANTHDDFGWEDPINLTSINSAFFDAGPAYFENDDAGTPLLYFTSGRPGGKGGNDIYVSEQSPDGSFGPPVLVPELNSPLNDARPSIRHDGLELFLFSGRAGTIGLQDLWVSSRETVSDPWSPPANLGGTVNSAFNEFQPHITSDRKSLYLASDRPGGLGGFDLYEARRTKDSGKK